MQSGLCVHNEPGRTLELHAEEHEGALWSPFTFADREEQIGIPRVKLELVDGVPVTYIMLEKKRKNDFLIHTTWRRWSEIR